MMCLLNRMSSCFSKCTVGWPCKRRQTAVPQVPNVGHSELAGRGKNDSQDCHQRTMITIFLTLDAYRILIGCFYTLFVPQLCPDTHIIPRPEPMTHHQCTLEDNVTDLTLLNSAALGINALTCFVMVVGFIQEYRREQWMIKKLHVDPKKPDSNLATEIQAYPDLAKSLHIRNRNYKFLFALIGLLSTVNIVVSGVLVYEYYDGMKTTTTFVTNTLLILMRIMKSIQISRTCQLETKAQSVYLTEPVTFNTIDPDYNKHSVPVLSSQPPKPALPLVVLEMVENPQKST
jgi:hypothetical protein